MRKIAFMALLSLIMVAVSAQNVREQIQNDIHLASSNYYVYPGPTTSPTPAPKGKRPFYISHYGRHGSRFLINQREYDYPWATLHLADSLGKLSERGHEIFQVVTALRNEAASRLGELTPLGAQQHREIARRMFERFPEVFRGDACVDAKSTIVIRCILSMQNALSQLTALNPQLRIKSDASEHDMYYMNLQDRTLFRKKWTPEASKAYQQFCDEHENYLDALHRLFKDNHWSDANINLHRLGTALFKLAASCQGTEVGRAHDLFGMIFNPDELYDNWLQSNAYWYVGYGACPYNGGTQPYTQRNLLRRIILEADSCLQLPRPGATLRFGHETIVLPLACLLGLNGFDQQVSDLNQLVERGWVNYRVFPMAANIQFVFYRKNPKDQDILVKVLLNENEATLPFPTDCAPYYHWRDVRQYYLDKLATYREEGEKRKEERK